MFKIASVIFAPLRASPRKSILAATAKGVAGSCCCACALPAKASHATQALAKIWKHELSGSQFRFYATGMNEMVLKMLRGKIPDYQKALEGKFPGVEIVFLPGNAQPASGGTASDRPVSACVSVSTHRS